jgi:hypothetical protein
MQDATTITTIHTAGLTPKAIHQMVAAEDLRQKLTVEAEDYSYLPSGAAQQCSKVLVSAFASSARSTYRPDGKKPILLAVSALKTLLGEFQDFPTPTTESSREAFDYDPYDRLAQWSMERSEIPDPETVDESEKPMVMRRINDLGAKTLLALTNDGVEHILPSDQLPEDPNGAKIEACIVALSKACRFGPFEDPTIHPDDIALNSEEASNFATEIIVAHNEFFSKSTEIAEEREEALTLAAGGKSAQQEKGGKKTLTFQSGGNTSGGAAR